MIGYCWLIIELGKIGIVRNCVMVVINIFEIIIIGKGGYGVEFYNCIDLIVVGNVVYLFI